MTKKTATRGATPEAQAPVVESKWTAYITPFAAAIGKSADEVAAALKALIGEPNDDAIASLQSEEFTPFDDIKAAFPDVPIAKLRMAIKNNLRTAATQEAPTAQPAAATNLSFDVLPSVPDDEPFLSALKATGELKVNQAVVIAAIRSALAARCRLYDVPAKLVEAMELHAEELEEPVGADFFALRNQITKRSYGDIFAAIPGLDGNFASQKRKDALIQRLDASLWPSLLSFQRQLKEFTEAWQQTSANPAALIAAFAMFQGGTGAILPPGLNQPPATDGLRDGAEGVVVQINKVFAGVNVPVAMALAYDALSIKQVLENPTLPMQIGAANREQMLKKLGVDVTADYVRLERNLTRFVLAIMEYPKVPAGNQELAYVSAMLMLGSQIPWDKLATPSAPLGRRSGMRGLTEE